MPLYDIRQVLKAVFVMAVGAGLLFSFQGCTKEKIIYMDVDLPGSVTKSSPVNGDTLTSGPPTLVWRTQSDAIEYRVQIDNERDFYTILYDTTITDTILTMSSGTSDGRYYWRVRAKNSDERWGDWSDESVWTFLFDAIQSPVRLLSQLDTYGYANDVTVVNERNRAYVADGQAGMTVVDITDKSAPSIVGNIYDSERNDFAMSIYIPPGDTFAFVADMDGKLPIFSISEPIIIDNFVTNFGAEQNTEEVTGRIINDTLYIIATSGAGTRQVQYYRVPYDDEYGPILEYYFNTPMVAECCGVDFLADSNFIAVANSQLGLQILDISEITDYTPPAAPIASYDISSNALSVTINGNYAFVSGDRSGMWIIDVTTPASPALVSNLDTSGRTKDISVVGNYAFLADANDGLKVIDITDLSNPTYVSSYTTPYAYGVWADSNYVYITDRDWGLLIFEIFDTN
ncbi:MAG: hypothetical protein GY855_07960 [candidate division Zixibacteria bacterium]|nr:hypothetical protein [candidate division Zixibacteria bacterium]